MNRLYAFTFILVCLVNWSKAERLFVHDKLVRLEPLTDKHINYLRDLEVNSTLDFWTKVITPYRPIDVHIRENEFGQYVSQFKRLLLPYNVLVDDLQKIIDDEQQQIAQERLMRQMKQRFLGQAKVDIVGTYASYDDMVAFLEEKASTDPSHVQVIDLGQTVQRRSIKIISLQFNPSSTRNIWIDCGIHARGIRKILIKYT